MEKNEIDRPATETNQENEVRVIIMEDHGHLCEVLRRTVSVSPGLSCCGHFKTARETLEAIPELKPDLISVDLSMPDLNGLTVLKQIRREWPEVRCVVFSGHSDEAYVKHSFEAGAMGYVYKEDVHDFIECLRTVARDGKFISPRFKNTVSMENFGTSEVA